MVLLVDIILAVVKYEYDEVECADNTSYRYLISFESASSVIRQKQYQYAGMELVYSSIYRHTGT